MTYISQKTLTKEDFLSQYRDHPHYELAVRLCGAKAQRRLSPNIAYLPQWRSVPLIRAV
jgi:hypothetical protein